MLMSAILDLVRGARSISRTVRGRWRTGEPIEMRERRYGYFPKAFISHGQRYDVYAVERCWTVSRWQRGKRAERRCFRVRCRCGRFDLYQDVQHNTWHLQRQAAS